MYALHCWHPFHSYKFLLVAILFDCQGIAVFVDVANAHSILTSSSKRVSVVAAASVKQKMSLGKLCLTREAQKSGCSLKCFCVVAVVDKEWLNNTRNVKYCSFSSDALMYTVFSLEQKDC